MPALGGPARLIFRVCPMHFCVPFIRHKHLGRTGTGGRGAAGRGHQRRVRVGGEPLRAQAQGPGRGRAHRVCGCRRCVRVSACAQGARSLLYDCCHFIWCPCLMFIFMRIVLAFWPGPCLLFPLCSKDASKGFAVAVSAFNAYCFGFLARTHAFCFPYVLWTPAMGLLLR